MDLYSPGVAGCKDSQTKNDSFSRRNFSFFFFLLTGVGCESVQQREVFRRTED